MKVEAIPSSPRDPARLHYLTTFLIDGRVAIDAGALAIHGSAEDQARVRDVFLTHVHADHSGGLPIFLENVIDGERDGPTVHGSAFTLSSLRQDIFNDRIWPNFVEMYVGSHRFVRLHEIAAERPVALGDLRITPIAVDHPIPTFGYLVGDGKKSVLFSGDTGPTARLWDVARATPDLRAVFLECSFPDELADLARRSGHLTPTTFAAELDKLARPEIPVYAFHLKARFRDATARQLAALARPNLALAELGRAYDF